MIYDEIYREYKRLENQILSLEEKINKLPQGSLVCAKNGNYTKWYRVIGNKYTYLKKENQTLAEQLALKKYYMLQLEDLLHERTSLEKYLIHHKLATEKAPRLLNLNSEYRPLLSSFFLSYSDNLQEWVNAPYNKNSNNPEQLIHKTISGNVVRSKSEALIDMALYQNKIPFRYESPLILNEITFFPDFTIRHPKSGQLMYWEHFGMMDNPNYCQNAYNKLKVFSDNGLIPSIHIITTFETKDCPLSSDLIEKIIKHYFM
ncbi:MAG: ATPase [bacterium]|nr:ATPase [bacterium]